MHAQNKSECADCTQTHIRSCGHAHMSLYWSRSPTWNFMVGLSRGFWRLSSFLSLSLSLARHAFVPSLKISSSFSFPLLFLSPLRLLHPVGPERSKISCGLGFDPSGWPSPRPSLPFGPAGACSETHTRVQKKKANLRTSALSNCYFECTRAYVCLHVERSLQKCSE